MVHIQTKKETKYCSDLDYIYIYKTEIALQISGEKDGLNK